MTNIGSLSNFLITSPGFLTTRPREEFPNSDLLQNDSQSKKSKILQSNPSFSQKPTKLSLPKPKVQNMELTKKQHKLKLNTSHQVIRAMVSLEDEQNALRDKSNFAKSFKRMSAGIKVLEGSRKAGLLNIIAENIGIYDEKRLKEVIPSIKRPGVKLTSNSANVWMKKRGLEMSSNGLKTFLNFLKNFFRSLNESSNGTLSPNDLIIPLLSLGLSNDAVYIEKALLSIFEAENINELQIDKENFINIFKDDKKIDIILKNLDFYCKSMLKDEEDKKVALRAAFRRQTTIFHHSALIPSEPFPEKIYPTIEEFTRLIRKWWTDLAHDNANVNVSRIAEFLAEKGIAANKHEGRTIAKSFESGSYFSCDSFEKIFVKPILKACLFYVAVFLNASDFENFSMRLKLAIVQRRFLMAGTKTRADPLARQGRLSLQAIDTYKKRRGGELSKPDKDNKLSLEAAEELNDQKILQILFKLKENAVQFLNEYGEVEKSIKNTWDINTNLIKNYEKHSPTLKFKEERYISSLQDTGNLNTTGGPYNRKVKLFRENFLFKKFNKLIGIYPEIKKNL